jgi:hypothetical protein
MGSEVAIATWLKYSAEGERAIRATNRLRALVHRLRREAAATPPNSRNAHLADINELGLVRAWSILEAYLTSRGDVILQRDLPIPGKATTLQAHVHGSILDDFRSWRGIETFWQAGLGLTGAQWKTLPEYKELRNVISHGLGYVRPRPGPKPFSAAMTRRLTAAKLTPRSYFGRVPLVDADLDTFLDVVRDFIKSAEAAVP